MVLSKISDNKLFVLYVGMIVKKNKYIKAKNKAQVTKGAPEIPHVTIQNAPANLRQPNEMPPEAVVFLLFRNDPLFQIGRQTVNSDDEDYGLRPSTIVFYSRQVENS